MTGSYAESAQVPSDRSQTESEANPSMTARWGEVTHRSQEAVTTTVDLTGAPTIRSKKGVTYQPYSIRCEFVRFNGGPWRDTISIYAQRYPYPGICGTMLDPPALAEVPAWLTGLINQARPDAVAPSG